jgi:hypothetical protein
MAAHLAAGLLSAPEARWKHGQDRAPDQVARGPHSVASGVQALLDAGKIGNPEVAAADRFRLDYLLGVEGVRDTDRAPGRCDPSALHVVQLARCHAITAHRAVADLIGPGMTQWLVAFVVEDLSCSAMSRRFHVDTSDGHKRMAARMEVLLEMLARLYARIDRRRGPRGRRDNLRENAAGEYR